MTENVQRYKDEETRRRGKDENRDGLTKEYKAKESKTFERNK